MFPYQQYQPYSNSMLKVSGYQEALSFNVPIGTTMALWDAYEPKIYIKSSQGIQSVLEYQEVNQSQQLPVTRQEFEELKAKVEQNGKHIHESHEQEQSASNNL
jgi:hypothetical protein